MFNLSPKKWLHFSVSACILLLACSCYPRLQQLEEQNLDTLYYIAETVGYTPDALVVQSRNCWDPSLLPPYTEECGIFLVFTTDASVTEVQTMIESLNYKELYHQSTFIGGLATLINLSTRQTLYIDGTDATKMENFAKLQTISGHYWNLRDHQDRPVNITLYLTADIDKRLAVDDMPVEQNLLLVHLALGRVYP